VAGAGMRAILAVLAIVVIFMVGVAVGRRKGR
jgi:hypothetical protein